MGFASVYLDERVLFPQQILEAPDPDTGIIVVVPSYNETGITKLLDSLAECKEPDCKTEVIIVINAPDNASDEILQTNRRTSDNIESWKNMHKSCFFRLFSFVIEKHGLPGWGVGLARKTGMDEAIRRFDLIERPEGVILNLDADCTVEANYFEAVRNELLNNKSHSACSIYFEHPLSGTDYNDNIFRYISLYELHLRYYFQGLAYSGFPYVFHTVGSAMAVKALPYMKAGGMNRRQAGEDFYFIQKLVPAGGFFSLNSTTVYPSPRVSSRVPFGTGASIGKLKAGESPTLLTYNMMAFQELRDFFGISDTLFTSRAGLLPAHYATLPRGLRSFMSLEEWVSKINEVRANTSGLLSFRKRFFGWFNMFRIVKYLNAVHMDVFEKKPVEEAASELLEASGIIPESKKPLELLYCYRAMERGGEADKT